MKLLYKILFEVKILHEYFLTNPDQTSVFQDATQTARLAWLSNRFAKEQPVLSADVNFQLPPCMTSLFKNQKLILLRSLAGFQVAIQVNEVQSGGTVSYAPAVPLPANCNMLILMRQQRESLRLLRRIWRNRSDSRIGATHLAARAVSSQLHRVAVANAVTADWLARLSSGQKARSRRNRGPEGHNHQHQQHAFSVPIHGVRLSSLLSNNPLLCPLKL